MAISFVPATEQEFLDAAHRAGVVIALEQTSIWARYQATVTDRTPWRPFGTNAAGQELSHIKIVSDGETLGYITFIDMLTHGYHFLRSAHGPVWIHDVDAQTEEEVARALVAFVHKTDKNVAFLRYSIDADIPSSRPVLSTRPYDSTVIIDLSGGDDEILKRMKSRGRRDVRKALRENDDVCSDETSKALADFSEYYAVMEETGARDGFAPAPQRDYEDMIHTLGEQHCRVFAARNTEGVLTGWSIVTKYDSRAVRFYAAMRSDARRTHVTDKLLYAECCMLSQQGVKDYDLMGIGSDFAPMLKGLNEFKTKFVKDISHEAPERDVPVKKGFYSLLCMAKVVLKRGQ